MATQRQVSTPVVVIVIAVVVILIAGIAWFRAPKRGPTAMSPEETKAKMAEQMKQMQEKQQAMKQKSGR